MASTILVSSIIAKARAALGDASAPYRRTDQELLAWFNLGQRQIVLMKLDANVTRGNMTLVAGAKQGTTGVALLEATRNANGATIRRTTKAILDALAQDWLTTTGNATVKFYAVDEHDPRVFWVYPPQPSSGMGTIEAVQSSLPADIAYANLGAAAITLDDVYEVPLIEYLCFRALSEDTDDASDAKAATHAQAFFTALGVKAQTDVALAALKRGVMPPQDGGKK